jgi:ABC-type antimicrobial peptide transport system ATPase subunit
VVLNGSNSEWKTINAGVPQFSILGTLLFLLFINDIITDIKASIKLFAVDTSLYVTVDTLQNAADIINRDLKKIHQWSVSWLVKFNPQKTETSVISRKLIKPLHPHWK